MESTNLLPLLLVSATLSEVGGKNLITECEEDHECGENKFCYRTGLCALCTNCTIYSRKPHDWKPCSKSPKECGECIPGYAADILTDGSMREVCTQIKLADGSTNTPGDAGQWSNWLYGVSLVGIPLVVLVVILLLCLKARGCRVGRAGVVLKTEQPVSESLQMRPPPYSSCGESPLLTRDTGGTEHCCGRAWHTDHQMKSSSYNDKECKAKTHAVEKTIDGIQQARPFEHSPDELKQILEDRSRPRTRSSCRPNDGTDHYDKDDDNEDGLSVTHDGGVNEVDHKSSGLSNNTEKPEMEMEQSEGSAAAKHGDLMLEYGCSNCALKRKGGSTEYMYDRHGSLCDAGFRPDHSTYSLCSETDAGCRCKVAAQCSFEKNLVKGSFITSKYDSGFMSKSCVKFEELPDDTFTENTQERRDKPFFTEGESININIPLNINVLNTVSVYQ